MSLFTLKALEPGNEHMALKLLPDHTETALNFRKNCCIPLYVGLNKAQSSCDIWATATLQNSGGKSLVQIVVMLLLA